MPKTSPRYWVITFILHQVQSVNQSSNLTDPSSLKIAVDTLAREGCHKLRLSQSDTKCVRLLRCAAAESVICKALVEHVFRDFFYPDTPLIIDAMTNIVDLLGNKPGSNASSSVSLVSSAPEAAADCRTGEEGSFCRRHREAVVRAQLLAHQASLYPDTRLLHKQVVDAALDQVSPVLNPFLSATEIKDFRSRLEALLGRIVAFWSAVQRNKARCTVFRLMDRVEDWDEEEDQQPGYHSGVAVAAAEDKSTCASVELKSMRELKLRSDEFEVVAVLFPQIVCEGVSVFRGRALFSTHRAVLMAAMERNVNVKRARGCSGSHKRKVSFVAGDAGAIQPPAATTGGSIPLGNLPRGGAGKIGHVHHSHHQIGGAQDSGSISGPGLRSIDAPSRSNPSRFYSSAPEMPSLGPPYHPSPPSPPPPPPPSPRTCVTNSSPAQKTQKKKKQQEGTRHNKADTGTSEQQSRVPIPHHHHHHHRRHDGYLTSQSREQTPPRTGTAAVGPAADTQEAGGGSGSATRSSST